MLILDRAGEQAAGQDPRGQGRYPIRAPEILGGQLFRVVGYPKHAAERFRPPGISASPASTRVTQHARSLMPEPGSPPGSANWAPGPRDDCSAPQRGRIGS